MSMTNRSFTSLLAAPAFILCVSLGPADLRGQGASIPRTIDGKPDVSGVWTSPGFKHSEDSKLTDVPTVGLTRFKDADLPFRPGGEKLWTNPMIGDAYHDDPTLLCFPWGFPFHTMVSNVQHFFQAPGYLVILYEDMHVSRVIPMDGRPHPKNIPPSYYGNSVGHYEGDAAVIDTIDLKPWGSDGTGHHLHTDAAHFIERYRRTGPNTISYELTVDDPKIFSAPFTCGSPSSHCFPQGNRRPEEWIMYQHPEWEVLEQFCEDNNKDVGLIDFLKKK
jgi:hypothetical protein